MTPEKKAKELVDKIEGVLGGSLPIGSDPYLPETKACALICVEEIKNADPFSTYEEYWQKVKSEIEKL